MLAGPWLVRHFLEGKVSHRVSAWAYLVALCASAGSTLVLLVAVLLRYLPHGYLARAGLLCHAESGCFAPVPFWASPVLPLLAAGILLGLLAYASITLCTCIDCSRRLMSRFTQSSSQGQARVLDTHAGISTRLRGKVILIHDPAPVSFVVGIVRSRVVISDGLIEALDEDEVAAVLAHEEGHVAARDTLVTLVSHTLGQTFALVPGVRLACRRLRFSQERAADTYASRSTGDPLVVASSLSKFARSLIAPTPRVAVASFADDAHVVERLRGLLVDEVVRPSRRRLLVAAVCLVLSLATFFGSAFAFSDVGLGGDASSQCAPAHETMPFFPEGDRPAHTVTWPSRTS